MGSLNERDTSLATHLDRFGIGMRCAGNGPRSHGCPWLSQRDYDH